MIATLKTHRWFVACALVSVLLFGWFSTGGTGRLFVTEPLADFYDHQAASLLKGRLDVPPEALSFEAFVYKGKNYGYFGITPALLRIPFVLAGVGFGQLSRSFMLGYFAAALVAAYLIFLYAWELGGTDGAKPKPWLVALFVANAGMGNTLLLLSSRAYVYHEAILCGAAFALWSVWCALRHFRAPDGRWWIGALVLGTLAVNARPPLGLFALTLVGVVGCAILFRRWQVARAEGTTLSWPTMRRALVLGLLAALGVLTFNGMSYLKFDTFNACPLQYHVQYQPQFDPVRLARFEGKQFHLSNIPFGFDGYVLRPNFSVSKYFPFFLIGLEMPTTQFPKAKMDWVEPTLAFPYAMPGLFTLATVGSLAAFATRRSDRTALALVWIAGLPMSLAMLAAVAMSHRYTADFCPLFICASAFSLAAFQNWTPQWRLRANMVVTGLTLPSVLITLLLTLYFQGERNWGVAEDVRANYAALRRKVDQLFGQTNPAGYSTANLLCRRVDASYNIWIVVSDYQSPATFAKGLARYERALRDQVFFSEIHFVTADIYLQLNNTASAIRALEKGVSLEPTNAKRQAKLAELLAAQDRTAEAIEHYKAALQVIPEFVAAHNNIGVAYSKLGRWEEALRHIETAHRLDPNYAEARSNLEKLRPSTKTSP